MAALADVAERQCFKVSGALPENNSQGIEGSSFTSDRQNTCKLVEIATKFLMSEIPEHIKAIPSTKEVLRNLWFQASEDQLVSAQDKYVYHVAR